MPLARLRQHLAEAHDLAKAADVLEWDQETYMPPGAAEARAQQIATLRELAHRTFASDKTGELLAEAEAQDLDPDGFDGRLVRVAREDYERERKLPARLVRELAEAVAHGKEAWKAARAEDDFGRFAEPLERLVALNREKADALREGTDRSRYDALLDLYEPGASAVHVERVFADLRTELVPLVEAVADEKPPEDGFLHAHYPPEAQWAFGEDAIRRFGYRFEHGRQDRSAHPFTTSFSITDVRLTTRIDEGFFPTAFFGTVHEAGHGMYEQGIDAELERTPLAEGASLGVHESQSRLWENHVARSLAYWRGAYPKLQTAFPDALAGVSLDAFYKAINKVEPSLIRVEADELTYPLHVMLRFELEQQLLAGDLEVADLPEAWNAKMESYLGLTPPSDADGCLQDIHWSIGMFGYFPTYALGTLMAAQLWDAAHAAMPDLEDRVAAGSFEALLAWLREHVHRWGRARTASEILHEATGGELSATSWLAYVRDKYGALYAHAA